MFHSTCRERVHHPHLGLRLVRIERTAMCGGLIHLLELAIDLAGDQAVRRDLVGLGRSETRCVPRAVDEDAKPDDEEDRVEE